MQLGSHGCQELGCDSGREFLTKYRERTPWSWGELHVERRRGQGGQAHPRPAGHTVCLTPVSKIKGTGRSLCGSRCHRRQTPAVSLRPAGIQARVSDVVPHRGQNATQPSSCQNPSSGRKHRGQKKRTVGKPEDASRCWAPKSKGTRRRRRNYGHNVKDTSPSPRGRTQSGGILEDESQPFSTSENIKAANSNLSVMCK